MRARRAASVLACAACAACGDVRGGGDFPAEPDFLRYVAEADRGPETLETAILRYADDEGRSVDLVAVVHIAERAYYEELDRRFRDYDGVLYELVAERGTRPEPGRESAGVLAFFQRGLKGLLELEFQLDWIDYSADNMVHADVSPEELDALFAERRETLFSSLLKAAFELARSGEAAPASPFALLAALLSEDRAGALKRLLARQFEDMDRFVAGFEDESGTSVIVTERNGRAMEVLAEELERGRERLAVFYGAAHMEDFHERLLEHGFEGRSAEWLVAWTIGAPAQDAPEPAAGD